MRSTLLRADLTPSWRILVGLAHLVVTACASHQGPAQAPQAIRGPNGPAEPTEPDKCPLDSYETGHWPAPAERGADALWRGCIRKDEDGRWLRHGPWTVTTTSGAVLERLTFERGKVSGPMEKWRDGALVVRGAYAAGVGTGAWEYYGDDGEVVRRRTWIDGREYLEEGRAACAHEYDSGDTMMACVDAVGRRDGYTYFWNEQGRLRAMGHFVEGRPVGEFVEWGDAGEVIKRIVHREDGTPKSIEMGCRSWRESTMRALSLLYLRLPPSIQNMLPTDLEEVAEGTLPLEVAWAYDISFERIDGEVHVLLRGRPTTPVASDEWVLSEDGHKTHRTERCEPFGAFGEDA